MTTRRLRKDARCSELSHKHSAARREADIHLSRYYRENDKADVLYDKFDQTSNEALAERRFAEWEMQDAKAKAAWAQHDKANKEAKRLIKAWSRLCGNKR